MYFLPEKLEVLSGQINPKISCWLVETESEISSVCVLRHFSYKGVEGGKCDLYHGGSE